MRPWEFQHCDMELWTEAIQMRNAYHEGVAMAREEKANYDHLATAKVSA